MKTSARCVAFAAALLLGAGLATAAEIKGTPGPDKLVGRDGDDVIKAFAGDDIVILRGVADHDKILCGSGRDTVDLSRLRLKNAWITADLGAGRIASSEVKDCENIIGSNSPDEDIIAGDDGRNWIAGGRGGDWLTGRRGADTFAYRSWMDSPFGGITDVIRDFSATEGDRIDLSALAGAGNKLRYAGSEEPSFSGEPGEFRSVKLSSLTWELLGDRDGDKQPDFRLAVVFKKATDKFPSNRLKFK